MPSVPKAEKYSYERNAATGARLIKFHHLCGALVGAGIGYAVGQSAESLATGAAIGGGATYAIEKAVVTVAQKILFDFVNK